MSVLRTCPQGHQWRSEIAEDRQTRAEPPTCPICGATARASETTAPGSGEIPLVLSLLGPPQAPDELGRLGPFRVLSLLGSGGMAAVFEADDPSHRRLVALKVMHPGAAADAAARQRFHREAQAAAKIHHENVVTIYQEGEDRGLPYLAIELLTGESLESRLRRESPLPVPLVLRIARESALGLAAIHDHGFIHRDIKPANLWLEGDAGRVKILDFGLAQPTLNDVQPTSTGAIVGTPAYMAPEQASAKVLDARCDLFGLGCVLYRACTGSPPFEVTDPLAALMAVATVDPQPPHVVNPIVPPDLSDLVMRLLAKEPAARPASARVVVRAIEAMEA